MAYQQQPPTGESQRRFAVSHVYHFTSSMHLPRILASGELRPLIVTEARTKYERGLAGFGATAMPPSVDFLHATSDSQREPTATPEYGVDGDRDGYGYAIGKWARVRFTLEAEDFEPWQDVARRNGYTERQIKALKDLGRVRGSDTRKWVSREQPLPMSRVVAIHTQDQINGHEWRLLSNGTKDVCVYSIDDTEIMGVDIGKVNFWSEPFINKNQGGLDGYTPLKVTAARPYGKREPGAVSKARLMLEPEYGEAKPPAPLAILNNPNAKADPLADLVASFKPKLPASRNAEIITTPVRYHLDTDLFRAFEYDQVQEHKAQLIAEGRWRLPNDGGRHTIRFNYFDIPEVFNFPDKSRSDWNGPNDGAKGKTSGSEWYIDFDMDGETMTRATAIVRSHHPGLSLEQKKLQVENPAIRETLGYDYSNASAWWEANGWLVHRCDYADGFETHAKLASVFLDVLVIALMDRSVLQVPTDRPEPSKKWKASGLAHPEQDVQEITIYCPGRVTGGNGTATHASPRMHWRRGHNRTLTKGRDVPLVVPIAPMWINADEESEKTIPLRSYKVKARAAEASPVEPGRKRA